MWNANFMDDYLSNFFGPKPTKTENPDDNYINNAFNTVASLTPARYSCLRTISFVASLLKDRAPSTLAFLISVGAFVLHSEGRRSTKWSMIGMAVGLTFG